MSTKDVVQRYYDSLNRKDTVWQDLWLHDGIFADGSDVLVAKGKDEIIPSFTTFLKGMKSVRVKQMIVEGENVCVIASYVYQNQKEETMNQDVAEVWEVKKNKLAKLVIYFDLTAYRAFMRG